MFWNWSVGKKFTPANLNAFKSAYKSSTEDRSSTTLALDSEMQFAMGANETWAFEMHIFSAGTGTTDIKYSIGFPTGAVCPWGALGGGTASLSAYSSNANDTPTSASTTRAVGMDGTTQLEIIKGTVFNGSTAGSLILYWAPNATDGANTASVRKGSHLIATRLD